MKHRKTGITALVLLGALPLAAIAATVPQQSTPAPATSKMANPGGKEAEPPMFQQLDQNHDGYISKAEAERSADLTARFAKLDTNHDGRISVEEYVKGKVG